MAPHRFTPTSTIVHRRLTWLWGALLVGFFSQGHVTARGQQAGPAASAPAGEALGIRSLPPAPRPTGAARSGAVRVVRAAGPVVELAGAEVELHLIGVFVPRDELGSAAEYLTRLLAHEQVWLDGEPGWPAVDREGRPWAYLYRIPDGLCVNLELLRQGYARLSAAQPFAHQAVFRDYEAAARRAGKCLWAADRARPRTRLFPRPPRPPIARSRPQPPRPCRLLRPIPRIRPCT